MKTNRFAGLVVIACVGASLSLSSPLRADPMMDDARADLEKAWSPSADTPPSNADRTSLLKAALDLIKKAPPGGYHGHRVKVKTAIESALYELDKGDPDGKATDLIHSAVDEIRQMTES